MPRSRLPSTVPNPENPEAQAERARLIQELVDRVVADVEELATGSIIAKLKVTAILEGQPDSIKHAVRSRMRALHIEELRVEEYRRRTYDHDRRPHKIDGERGRKSLNAAHLTAARRWILKGVWEDGVIVRPLTRLKESLAFGDNVCLPGGAQITTADAERILLALVGEGIVEYDSEKGIVRVLTADIGMRRVHSE